MKNPVSILKVLVDGEVFRMQLIDRMGLKTT